MIRAFSASLGIACLAVCAPIAVRGASASPTSPEPVKPAAAPVEPPVEPTSSPAGSSKPAPAPSTDAASADDAKASDVAAPTTLSPVQTIAAWLAKSLGTDAIAGYPNGSTDERVWLAWYAGGPDVPLASLRDVLVADGWTAERFVKYFASLKRKSDAITAARAKQGVSGDAKPCGGGGCCGGTGKRADGKPCCGACTPKAEPAPSGTAPSAPPTTPAAPTPAPEPTPPARP